MTVCVCVHVCVCVCVRVRARVYGLKIYEHSVVKDTLQAEASDVRLDEV